ncbi:MAG: hypothetical protein IKE53_08195 [Clostridiales bacterium]|nr:hypothetical protein [Clostridiales bacterium]
MNIGTKIASVALCAATVFSMTSCSFLLGGSKLGAAKLESYAAGEGAQEMESAKIFLDADEDDLEEGVYVSVEGKDCKKILTEKDLFVIPVLKDFYDKSMQKLTIYVQGTTSGSKRDIVYAMSIVFEDEDSAEDYFDSIHDGIQPNPGISANNDDGTDEDIDYTVMNISDDPHYAAVGGYRDGNTVLFLIGYGNSKKVIKNVDAICEALGVHQVTDT